MIGRIEAFLRRLRRAISRSEWLVTLLRLPRSTAPPTSPGLVMVQIDGLSHTQFSHALERGELPFLRRLIKREHYRQHRMYAGVPATTAAFQGELFYGVKAVVPGFNFLDSASGKVVRMVEPAVAAGVERELEENGGEPLLKGGSSYANNYTGGAAEPHFCPSSMGWGPSLRRANPLLVGLLVLSNAWSFVRLTVLLLLEFILAIQDLVRGLFGGYDFIKELKFVPTRVAISILLRELVTIGAKIDVARGLPVIHLNLLGYDEQAHRRGPSSLFAHWTLKGIDDAIARIWRAAQRSAHRHYDVWVYSDHGQEAVKPYDVLYDCSIEDAVFGVFADLGINVDLKPVPVPVPRGIQTQRVRQLGGNRIQRLFPVSGPAPADQGSGQVTVAGMGPVGFVYYDQELDASARDSIARALATTARVPLVLTADGPERVTAWT
ncbi:MAG: alkaline phosphatase family protein, partial [Gammaproteobacteria bacterium]|nr:alkaline phosphatase family protein [Gammaproteobacteria bacterium]